MLRQNHRLDKATCCFQGVAPTKYPVFKSCKLSFEIAAVATITLVVKIAKAIANLESIGSSNKFAPKSKITKDETIIPISPIPEIGLEEDPTSPAIYPQAAATKKPIKTETKVPTKANKI